MNRSRWHLGIIASLLGSLAFGQVPGTIPPIKLPPTKLPAKPVPGMAEAIEAQRPFIARYAYCNAMQLYQSRRSAWEPIYQDAGATVADLDAYSGNLVTYIKEFCSNGRPPRFWQEALARVEALDDRVDAEMATSLGISLLDATQLRISRLLAQLEKLREGCLGGGAAAVAEEQMSVFGSLLPATSAPPGLELDPKSPAASLGKCGKGGGLSGGGLPDPGLDRSTLSACVADALAQSGSCTSPVGDAPAGAVVRRVDLGRSCGSAGTTQFCSNTERREYANDGFVEVTSASITFTGKDGNAHDVRTERRRTVGSADEVISDYTLTYYDGKHVARGRSESSDDMARRITEDIYTSDGVDLETPTGYRAVTEHFVSPDRRTAVHSRSFVPRGSLPSGPGRVDNCATVNPGSSQPLGFARTESGDDGRGSPVHAGRLDVFDLVGQCVCNSLGRLGPGLAAKSGFKCGPDANSVRLDCLLNPRGPADGIRRECVEYLHADNPDRDTPRALNEWCGRVAQCPPGAGLASMAPATGIAMCSCGTGLAAPGGGGGSTPGRSRCAAVSCAGGAGAAGSDLYRQCCGAPGELPVTVDPTPGSPVPRPPDPGQLPKKPMPEMPKQPLPPK